MKSSDNTNNATPIRDGDTRPDQNIEGKTKKTAGSPMASQKKKMTKERGADVDSVEDFRDAKDA
jgi:hypothetical protein